jgi:hypothetical protein
MEVDVKTPLERPATFDWCDVALTTLISVAADRINGLASVLIRDNKKSFQT